MSCIGELGSLKMNRRELFGLFAAAPMAAAASVGTSDISEISNWFVDEDGNEFMAESGWQDTIHLRYIGDTLYAERPGHYPVMIGARRPLKIIP